MAILNDVVVFHRLDSTLPYAIIDNIGASRAISHRFSRGITSFLVAVGLSLPLGILPFRCWTFVASGRTSSHD